MDETKHCTICGITKPINEFFPAYNGYMQGRCKPCSLEYNKTWYRTPHGRISKQISTRKSFLKTKFGITLEQYNELLESQDGVCAICRQEDPCGRLLSIDHNHKTGRIRGLLCRACNSAIGLFDDDVEKLKSALNYLSITED